MLTPQPRAARRYARALFDLAVESGVLESVRTDICAILDVVSASLELQQFIAQRVLPRHAREQALNAVLSGRVNPLTHRFVMFLEHKRRLPLLSQVIAAFLDQYDKAMGLVKGVLATPFSADEMQAKEITGRMQDKTSGRLSLSHTVDPALLGGFKVQIGDMVYDLTTETQLRLLRRQLVSA